MSECKHRQTDGQTTPYHNTSRFSNGRIKNDRTVMKVSKPYVERLLGLKYKLRTFSISAGLCDYDTAY